MSFGEQLVKARKAKGMTQQVLAVRTGMSVSHIASLENDRYPTPSVETVVKLTRELRATFAFPDGGTTVYVSVRKGKPADETAGQPGD